jgi:hypothetical protein
VAFCRFGRGSLGAAPRLHAKAATQPVSVLNARLTMCGKPLAQFVDDAGARRVSRRDDAPTVGRRGRRQNRVRSGLEGRVSHTVPKAPR